MYLKFQKKNGERKMKYIDGGQRYESQVKRKAVRVSELTSEHGETKGRPCNATAHQISDLVRHVLIFHNAAC